MYTEYNGVIRTRNIKICGILPTIWTLNSTLSNSPWISNKNKKKIRKYV